MFLLTYFPGSDYWQFTLSIDPNTWKPIITDPHEQWDNFKKLDLKRIVSFGGWAYSTEPATYNIIRRAIINNSDTFARNLAQFAKDKDIDGIDINWEYPGVSCNPLLKRGLRLNIP